MSILEKDKRVQIWVHPRLVDVLSSIQKEIAITLKKKFGLNEITINGPVASEALAARYLEDAQLHFKIKRAGINKGTLEFSK